MQTKRTCWILATMTWICLEGAAHIVLAQQTADMPGVENSVGYLSSGTSIEPKTTSESSPMIHFPGIKTILASGGSATMRLSPHDDNFMTNTRTPQFAMMTEDLSLHDSNGFPSRLCRVPTNDIM